MNAVHASARDLELYVIGALDPASAARVEAHVCDCEACAASLAGEARLEMAFEQIAIGLDPDRSQVRRAVAKRDAASRAVVTHRRTVTIACALGGALSIAAAWFLWVTPAPQDARALGAPTVDVNADAETTTASLDAMKTAGLDGG